MNKTTLKYDYSNEFLEKLLQYDPAEIQLLCPHCGTELVFAPTWELATKFKVHPGIYCLQNEKHVATILELTDPKKDKTGES